MDAILQAKQLKKEATLLTDSLYNRFASQVYPAVKSLGYNDDNETLHKVQRVLRKAQNRHDRRAELYANAKWPQRIQGPK